jgi:hypothetical protein
MLSHRIKVTVVGLKVEMNMRINQGKGLGMARIGVHGIYLNREADLASNALKFMGEASFATSSSIVV